MMILEEVFDCCCCELYLRSDAWENQFGSNMDRKWGFAVLPKSVSVHLTHIGASTRLKDLYVGIYSSKQLHRRFISVERPQINLTLPAAQYYS